MSDYLDAVPLRALALAIRVDTGLGVSAQMLYDGFKSHEYDGPPFPGDYGVLLDQLRERGLVEICGTEAVSGDRRYKATDAAMEMLERGPDTTP